MEFSTAPFQLEESGEHESETLTVLQAARRAGVTQSAIIRWIRNGYISATPSSSGWLIPAGMLDEAARSADEARGTGPVPRKTTPSLTPVPTPIRDALESRAVVATPAQATDIGENIVAPLAELIRDQIDVVHDQAEVIGWLQAERARLTAELALLKAEAGAVSEDAGAAAAEKDIAADKELYDEVLSLLWKDADTHDDSASAEADLSVEFEQQPDLASPVPEPDLTAPDPSSNGNVVQNHWVFNPPEITGVATPEPTPKLRLEDYADPSWFFGYQSTNETFGEEPTPSRPAPSLKPIVPRGGRSSSSLSGDDDALHRMIDETERKIAELWRNEEQLRNTPRVADRDGYGSGRGRWQRLWPRRR